MRSASASSSGSPDFMSRSASSIRADCPAEEVTPDNIDTFLVRLNQLTGKHYRLPTEAEWEYAAASGISTRKSVYAGAGSLGALGWYSGNAMRRVHPVAQKKANLLGLYDLSGNVWEWCHDWYDKNYYAQTQDAVNPAGPFAGETRVLRGGSWNNSGKHCRIANRTSRFTDFRDGSVGFRVARMDRSTHD